MLWYVRFTFVCAVARILVYIQMYPLTFKPFRACNFLVSEPSFVATTLELEIIKTRGESGYFSKNSRNQYIREKP